MVKKPNNPTTQPPPTERTTNKKPPLKTTKNKKVNPPPPTKGKPSLVTKETEGDKKSLVKNQQPIIAKGKEKKVQSEEEQEEEEEESAFKEEEEEEEKGEVKKEVDKVKGNHSDDHEEENQETVGLLTTDTKLTRDSPPTAVTPSKSRATTTTSSPPRKTPTTLPEHTRLLDDDDDHHQDQVEPIEDELEEPLTSLPGENLEVEPVSEEEEVISDAGSTEKLVNQPEPKFDRGGEEETDKRKGSLVSSEDSDLPAWESDSSDPLDTPHPTEEPSKPNTTTTKKTFSPPLRITKSTLAEPQVQPSFVTGTGTSSSTTLHHNSSTKLTKPDNIDGILPGQAMGLPKEFDITMTQAAQLGNLVALEHLLDQDPNLVNELDSGMNSPLHWASINNKLDAVKFLISRGADPNAQGGELKASPLHWACRQGLLDMMALLVELGADPRQQDSQGFNILHLSVHSANLLCLIYSLTYLESDIDLPDAQGHTALMWAAYQGFTIAVDLLLRFGAKVDTRDSTQYTPLHWGVVKGDQAILEKLISHRADLKAMDAQGQTPSDVALNTKTEVSFHAALKATGYNPTDLARPCKSWTKRQVKTTALLLPFPVMSFIFGTLVYFPWVMAFPLVLGQMWLTFHFGIKRLLKKCYPALSLQESPYHVGIFLTTILFTFVTYFTAIAKDTFATHLGANCIFSGLFAASLYFYFLATLGDPGFLPRHETLSTRSDEIQRLAKEGRLSPRFFCTSCLAPRPLRSKHCRFCDRCVARFDHHCPWNYNCVGAHNHRDFMLFVVTLAVGIGYYLYLGEAFLAAHYISYVPVEMPCLFNDRVCGYFQQSPFVTFHLIWSAIQLFWISMVLFYQLFLIARATTTNEQINHDKYSYFIASPLSDPSDPPRPPSSSATLDRLTHLFHSRSHSHRHSHPVPHRHFRNPFDHGLLRNCFGFWSHRPGTQYWKSIYDPPNDTVDYSAVPLQEITTSSSSTRWAPST